MAVTAWPTVEGQQVDPPRAGAGDAAAGQGGAGHTGRAFLTADWDRALFLHFEVPPAVLQPRVPFALDLFEGRAFVSLVAFTMRNMRLARAGRLARWLCAPLAEQRFLNMRTYVNCGDRRGIYFVAEWISLGLCVPFGPITYGLPYRWGRLDYRHEHERGVVCGRVAARRSGHALEYEAGVRPGEAFAECPAGSLVHFLVERYLAFTQHGKRRAMFQVGHDPWRLAQVPVAIRRDDLLRQFGSWWESTRLVSAAYSPGVRGVWMGRPQRNY